MTTDLERRWSHIEYQGRERARKSTEIFEGGGQPTDTFTHEGMAIHDPWIVSCGRFKCDPYAEYGRAYVMWLLEDTP